jgi:hypothetical protein
LQSRIEPWRTVFPGTPLCAETHEREDIGLFGYLPGRFGGDETDCGAKHVGHRVELMRKAGYFRQCTTRGIMSRAWDKFY